MIGKTLAIAYILAPQMDYNMENLEGVQKKK